MPTKTKQKVEFGDFQTPDVLALATCEMLNRLGVSPRSIVEPTCGRGSFLRASTSVFPNCTQVIGFEINPDYVKAAKAVERADVYCEDFFEKGLAWNVEWSSRADPRYWQPTLGDKLCGGHTGWIKFARQI